MVNDEIRDKVRNLKIYASENNVPIMMNDGIDFLVSQIDKRGIKHILEIGTAIGYSSIMMALSNDVSIVTIEKDPERYKEAVKNVKLFKLEDKIELIYNDALEVCFKEKFDLIFIDAAKSKNKDLFNRFKDNLNDNGIIVTDNLKFHGFVDKDLKDITNRNTRQLVRKIKEYTEFLKNNEEYETVFFDIGDGLAITMKRK